MKAIYAIALCCGVCLSANADGLRFKTAPTRFKTVRNLKDLDKARRAESGSSLWRPVSQTDFMHDGEGWMELGTVNFKYDINGNCTEELVDEDGSLYRTINTYNEFNQPLEVLESESEDGETWENSEKTNYVYDPVIHDFFTERAGYDWSDGEWVMNYKTEANDITRNPDGNITEVVKSLPLFNELKPAYKSEWGYDADGNANEYNYYVAGQDGGWDLYDETSYRNIEWNKTNGQMTVFGDLLELTEGENQLKSAVVYYDGQPDGHYLVEYSEGLPGFFIKETTNDINEIGRTVKMETLDANGSIQFTTTEYFDEEGIITSEPTFIDVQTALMDDHGNMVEFTERGTLDGMEEIIVSTKYNYTYDANGNVAEVISEEYDYESEEYLPSERTLFGEYIDVATSGICNPGITESAAWSFNGNVVTASAQGLNGISVYSVQGTRVAHAASDGESASVSLDTLTPGIYIVRADGTGSVYRIVKR